LFEDKEKDSKINGARTTGRMVFYKHSQYILDQKKSKVDYPLMTRILIELHEEDVLQRRVGSGVPMGRRRTTNRCPVDSKRE
jgi:hypothetical protein